MDASEAVSVGRRAIVCAAVALAIAPLNFVVWLQAVDGHDDGGWFAGFTLLALVQLALGLVALISGIQARKATGRGGIGSAIAGVVAMLGAPVGWLLGLLGLAFASGGMTGGAWGRPLRIRGKQLHCGLGEGSDWTRGDRPDASGLDVATRRALEALWLHDAQKEHASVPAFSRVSWMLAAMGAPAELLEGCHRAAMEEIEHTRLCFALAAGYGGRSHQALPMPDLLGGLADGGDPVHVLAVESLADGCQLEDFNADVAAACARVCREPTTRAVLEQIAIEERSHAELSWAIVTWLLERHAATVGPALRQALAKLEAYPRPTAVSEDKHALVAAADPDGLRAHGRLPDTRWAELWQERLRSTEQRLRPMLDGAKPRAA